MAAELRVGNLELGGESLGVAAKRGAVGAQERLELGDTARVSGLSAARA